MKSKLASCLLGVSLAVTGCSDPRVAALPSEPIVVENVVKPTRPRTLTFLVCCDSITAMADTGSYRPAMTAMLAARGIEARWVVTAVSGSRCAFWEPILAELIAVNDPDVVLINCGTNDPVFPGVDEARFAEIYAAMIDHGRAAGVKLAVSTLQISRVDDRPDLAWLPANEARANVKIIEKAGVYADVALADIASIPATIENNPDGVHPGFTGSRLYAAAWIAAGASKGWWVQ
jgi:hypothetical protein